MKTLGTFMLALKLRTLGFLDEIRSSDAVSADDRGEAYIGEAIKILIAVVIGALLLGLAYALMKDTVFPTVTAKIQELFDFKG